ncbi:MAG: hypothetical protein ACPGRX_03415 [Bdellovibrionales bacterium]
MGQAPLTAYCEAEYALLRDLTAREFVDRHVKKVFAYKDPKTHPDSLWPDFSHRVENGYQHEVAHLILCLAFFHEGVGLADIDFGYDGNYQSEAIVSSIVSLLVDSFEGIVGMSDEELANFFLSCLNERKVPDFQLRDCKKAWLASHDSPYPMSLFAALRSGAADAISDEEVLSYNIRPGDETRWGAAMPDLAAYDKEGVAKISKASKPVILLIVKALEHFSHLRSGQPCSMENLALKQQLLRALRVRDLYQEMCSPGSVDVQCLRGMKGLAKGAEGPVLSGC